ncbi:mor transcription activator family protein [Salmonella enterica subsp. enterica serovar Stanley]|nr:mor transcription activator family protein [Salmonella enterica subsp. enterica serovar Virchow]EFT4510146.1 mor transcription activator family protein [Salmonella enterica subsp. enterica serovar Stanley]
MSADIIDLSSVKHYLPDSAFELVEVLGWPAAMRLVSLFGGVSVSGTSGRARERTGGVHQMLREALTEDEVKKLIRYCGSEGFYIPRCDVALRVLRNVRFIADLDAAVAGGLSVRQALARLCPRYGFSDRYAWSLIRRRKDNQTLPKGPVQTGLFD